MDIVVSSEKEALDLLVERLTASYGVEFEFNKSDFSLYKEEKKEKRTDYYFKSPVKNYKGVIIRYRRFCIDSFGEFMILPT